MTVPSPEANGQRPKPAQRLAAYQDKLRALKERSALREVMERELLLKFIEINKPSINEYPLLQAQQQSVVELLCARSGHPGYEFIHKHIANFIAMLAHYGKAIKLEDRARAQELQATLVNTEAIIIKCVQGIVYAMALITDNFEEIVLRYFGQSALKQYSSLIEKFELNDNFWKAFVEEFVASRVEEAHKEILEGGKYDISKERNFLVIRFLFDDILSKLNPTTQKIDRTRIQKSFAQSVEEEAGIRQAALLRSIMVKSLSNLSKAQDITQNEYAQAANIICMDASGPEFAEAYTKRVKNAQADKEQEGSKAQDPEEAKREQVRFKFLMDQAVAVGLGAAIAIGRTSDYFYKAMDGFVPEQIGGIRPLARDFSIPVLERILYFLLENHTIHMLQETGRAEGGKIQVRSGRARRVPADIVDQLRGMSKIRKKQLFANDVTRENTLLFKPKTAKQMATAMSVLSLEPDLQKALSSLWKQAVFRVDIMVLLNLELIARTTTNLTVKLGEILGKYGVSQKRKPTAEPAEQPTK